MNAKMLKRDGKNRGVKNHGVKNRGAKKSTGMFPKNAGSKTANAKTTNVRTGNARTGKKTVKKTVRRSAGKLVRKTTRIAAPNISLFETESPAEHRLQKILASAGFGSRRDCEEIIEQGRVEINGSIAKLGCKANPLTAEIKVDGERLKKTKPVYLALFKPKGYLCTDSDQQGRVRAIDLIPESFGRLFLIGRLDKDSEGLILLTNDGALSELLTHPKYGAAKIYRVQVAGEMSESSVKQIREGVYLAEGLARAENAVVRGKHKQSTILDITLSEGKNREVRRLFAKIGHKVLTLIRTAVGPVKLGKMAPGEWRKLTPTEVDRLYAAGEHNKSRRRPLPPPADGRADLPALQNEKTG